MYSAPFDQSYIPHSQPPIISPFFNQKMFPGYNQYPIAPYAYTTMKPSIKTASSLLNSPSAVNQIPNVINQQKGLTGPTKQNDMSIKGDRQEESKEIKYC